MDITSSRAFRLTHARSVIYLDIVVILENLFVLWEVQLIEPAFDIHWQLVEEIRRNVCNSVVTVRALGSYLCSLGALLSYRLQSEGPNLLVAAKSPSDIDKLSKVQQLACTSRRYKVWHWFKMPRNT